jgi:pimeloyl-ACP methyl ester carboxylesterase
MAGDVELYYESLGEGMPLVLQGHDHTPWLFGQAPVFSQRYRVLVYDRRGTGRSSSPDGDWSAADLAGDLVRFLDALAIERAIVGGSSLGGVITAQFAVDHPERALALVIGHTVPTSTTSDVPGSSNRWPTRAPVVRSSRDSPPTPRAASSRRRRIPPSPRRRSDG